MNYTVAWNSIAANQMHGQLLRASDKQQMLRAARTVENALRRDPWTAGEARDATRRILFERPLLFLFRIDEGTRTVFIELVKWVGH